MSVLQTWRIMSYTKHKELLAGLTIRFGKELDLKTLKTSLTSRYLKVQDFEVNIELEPFFQNNNNVSPFLLFQLFIKGKLSSSPQLSWAIKRSNSGVYWAQIMAMMELRRGHEVGSVFIQQTSYRRWGSRNHKNGRKLLVTKFLRAFAPKKELKWVSAHAAVKFMPR